MKRTITSIILTLLFFMNSTAYAAQPPSLTAEGALLIDMNTGSILYSKNKDTVFYPASTTKIMTALLVLENCKLDDKVIIGKKPSSFVDGSKIYIYENEEFTVEQLLYALMVESANDVAIALGEHVSGTEENFVMLMNEKAKLLGCLNTKFANPHGLHDDNHYTTAYDLSLIAKEAMKNDALRKIVSTKSYTVEPTNKQKEKRYLHSSNRLLVNPEYCIEGINGVKTGYTSEAGHSFVGTVYRENKKLMVVLLRDKKPGLWEDALALFNYGIDNFNTIEHVSAGTYVTSLRIGNTDIEVPLVAEKSLLYTYDTSNTPVVQSNVNILNDSKGNITKGQKIGSVEYSIGGTVIGKVNLLADSDLLSTALYAYETNEKGIFEKAYSSWLFIPAVCFLIVMLMMSLKVIKRKRSNR